MPEGQVSDISRLTTIITNPLIFSINADYQWVRCSQNVPIEITLSQNTQKSEE